MGRKNALLLVFLVVMVLFLLWLKPSLPAGRGSLSVTATYTGLGAVDGHHKIYVLLTDSNPFTPAQLIQTNSQSAAVEVGTAHVLACKRLETNGSVTFQNIPVSPVYAVAFFDKNGTYDGPPRTLPPGTPMGVRGPLPDKWEPVKVEVGKTAQITLAFDDSIATP